MARSDPESEFVSYAVDLLQTVGPATARRMFGGYGIFIEGLMFALVARNTLYLKVDEQSVGEFTEKGLEPFTYARNNRVIALSYYQAPEETLENIDEMNLWGNKAYAAALRAAAGRQ